MESRSSRWFNGIATFSWMALCKSVIRAIFLLLKVVVILVVRWFNRENNEQSPRHFTQMKASISSSDLTCIKGVFFFLRNTFFLN